MSEVKYDSVLCGFAEEPRYTEDGKLMGWSVRFKDHELKEIAEKYLKISNPTKENFLNNPLLQEQMYYKVLHLLFY